MPIIQHKTTRMVMNAKQSRHLIQHKTTNYWDGNECQTK